MTITSDTTTPTIPADLPTTPAERVAVFVANFDHLRELANHHDTDLTADEVADIHEAMDAAEAATHNALAAIGQLDEHGITAWVNHLIESGDLPIDRRNEAARILAAWHGFDHGYGPDPDQYSALNFHALLVYPRPTLSFHDGTAWVPDEDETDLNDTGAKPVTAVFVAVPGDPPQHASDRDLLVTASSDAVYWAGDGWYGIPFPYNPNFVIEWNDRVGEFATCDTSIGGRDEATILAGLRDLNGPWRAFMWDADECVLDTDTTLDAFDPDDPTTVPAGISIVRGDSLPFAPGVRVSFDGGPLADTLYDVDVDVDGFLGEWTRAVALADTLSKVSAAINASGIDL